MKKILNYLKNNFSKYMNFKKEIKSIDLNMKESIIITLIPFLVIIILFFIPYSFIFSAGIFDLLNGGRIFLLLFILVTLGSTYIYEKVKYEMYFIKNEALKENLNFGFILMFDTIVDTILLTVFAQIGLLIGGIIL
jgi:hypothetical protein